MLGVAMLASFLVVGTTVGRYSPITPQATNG
jgi:hypothetical protein